MKVCFLYNIALYKQIIILFAPNTFQPSPPHISATVRVLFLAEKTA